MVHYRDKETKSDDNQRKLNITLIFDERHLSNVNSPTNVGNKIVQTFLMAESLTYNFILLF